LCKNTHILEHLFTTVYIPDAVYQETVTDNPILLQRSRIDHATHSFIQVKHPKIHRLFTRNLGDGEQGVLNLAMEMHPDFILLDNRKARHEAKDCGVSALFTTEVLKWVAQHQYIQSY
jgi:predicted nucleic acid-binding protein